VKEMALNVGELYAQLTLESNEFDQGVNGIKGQLGKLGGMVTGAFAGVMAGAVGALGGAIVGGVASVNSYQKAMNGLQTQTGATAEEMASMGEQMKGIYSRNFGESWQDIADTMAYAKQATGAVGEELEYLTQDALMLRDTFQMDVTESLRGADMLMNQFGSTGTEAMAMIAEATQKGLNKNGDLVDTIEEYSVYFGQAGLGAQEMFGILENASKAGVRNLDYVGDAFKEMIIRTKDGSKTTIEAYKALGLNADKMMSDFASGGEKGKQAYQTMMEALNAIQDPVKKNTIGVQIFGTKFEDLEAKAIEAMANMNGTIKGSVDTINEINEIKYDDFGTAMQGIGRQIMVGLIMPIGEKLLPHLNTFANWIQTKIPAIQEFFAGLGQKVGEVFGGMGSKIESAKGIFDQLKTAWITGFQTIWGVVGPLVTLIGQKVMEVFRTIIDWWNANGSSLLENVMIVFQGIWSVIQFIMPAILAIVSMVFENVKGVITGALNIISGVFAIFAGLFTGNWSKMWEGVKTLIGGAIQFIWNLWNLMLVGKLLAGIKALGAKALSGFKGMWTKIQNGFGAFVSWIQGLIGKLVSGAVSRFTSMKNRAVSIFNTLRAFGASIFNAIWQVITNIIGRLVSGVTSKVTSMKDRAVSIFNSLKSRVTTIFNNVKTAITKPIESAKKTVLGIIEKIKGAFDKMKIKIPKPKLPKINVGSKKVAGVPIPTFDVDWFKTGGIATGPAIAGIGEAGSEAIVPLSGQRMKPFAYEIAKQMAGAMGQIPGGSGGNPVVVELTIDGRQFARATTKYIDEERGRVDRRDTRARGLNVT
jgi:phage-related minor tail protein